MTKETEILRWEGGRATAARDRLAVEEPLAIRVDGQTLAITMRTPGRDRELAAGFLLSEAIVSDASDCRVDEQEAEHPNRVDVTLLKKSVDIEKLSRHVFTSSSCGLCGKTSIERVRLPFALIKSDLTARASVLTRLPDTLRKAQATFASTGGLHAAGVFTEDGTLVDIAEDIGRHNAVDKITGSGLLSGRLPFSRHVLLVSGRASFEILQKALAGGFPIVAAVSAPSSLAVEFAKASRQTLVGFLRDGRMNVYSGAERIRQ